MSTLRDTGGRFDIRVGLCIFPAVARKKKQKLLTYAGLIAHFGSQAEAARRLDIAQQTVSDWQKRFPKRSREWAQLKIASL